MDLSEIVALVALVVSGVAAAFTLWQALEARKANKVARKSAKAAESAASSARISADAAVEANKHAEASASAANNQDRRDAERLHKERYGWKMFRVPNTNRYGLENLQLETAFIHEITGPCQPTLLGEVEHVEPGESLIFVIDETVQAADRRIKIDWASMGGNFHTRVIPLPEVSTDG